MSAHCDECACILDYFGLIETDDINSLGQWHADHPGWHVSAEEEAAMVAYTGGEWST